MINLVIKVNKLVCGLISAVLLGALVLFLFRPPLVRPAVSITEPADVQTKIQVPILMYHSILKDSSKSGQYVITPAQFENDLQYIQANGFTPVFMTDLINYVHYGTPLPAKPVVITFDDGYYNNYLYAFPLLQQYGMKGVISIIGYQTERYTKLGEINAYYTHCTWDHINEMIASGNIEIQNHTYNLHTTDQGRKGCAKKSGESLEEYTAMLTADIGKLQQKLEDHTGIRPNTFTYPFGSFTKETKQIVRDMGFLSTLCCESGISTISRDPNSLYMLKRFLRTNTSSAAEYLKKVA